MDWPSPCRMPAFHPKMEKGWKWLLCVHVACLGSCVWMLGLVPLLKFSCHTNVLGGHISTKCLPLPSRREGSQGRWCFTPVRWQRVLFYLPMPCSFRNTERNQGELMHPGKCWVSVQAHFCKCQSPLRGFTWEACWVLPSPVSCFVPAGEILLVALGLLIPVHSFLVICLELVPNQWCCTTSPPESWICLM